ncbi:TrbC family F-type conjugative pilus assembly protein [Vibrio cholerae]|uniref:TrbC family F-type conjugative pilus assembly protein n=1 Tax=Vibrio cholerae TaxID=666 RepID=UPI0018F0A589|nr:TrbC family F-type conjugative pilus assembly protein [Vibrio cholerae]MBJ6953201.1 hypothetical protein [Vibrio cholerae]
MSFFRKKLGAGMLLGLTATSSFAAPTLTAEDMATFEQNKKLIQQSKKMDAPSWLRQYDANAPVESAPEGVKRWIPAAQQIGDDSHSFIEKTIQDTYKVVDKSKIRTIDMKPRPDSPLKDGEELYYFVSFSQPVSELKDILKTASEVDARVVLRGMRPEDKMVNQTAAAMYGIAKEFRPTPKVSIDPRLHTVFGITQAPAMVYRNSKDNHIVTVNGVASLDWFLEKSRDSKKTENLGVVSSTYDIIERDVIEEIQERVAAVDWDAKRRKAMNRYIQNLPDFLIPTAQEDAMYKIDPRVQFHKDVTAKDGTLLATKGQVVNPIDHFPGMSLTLYIFDGLSEQQRALVHEEIKNGYGKIGLMTSRIDKEEGFKFISDLSKEYKQQVYMLQERMINRFQIRKLPVQIYLGNGEIVVREYGVKAQEDALMKQRMKGEVEPKTVAVTGTGVEENPSVKAKNNQGIRETK